MCKKANCTGTIPKAEAMKKYEQIATEMVQWIKQQTNIPNNIHHKAQGIKMPTVRALSKQYNCSISTVIRAYSLLEDRHIIYAMPQSGYYVVRSGNDLSNQASAEGFLDFASAAPDPRVFPYGDFKHCMDQAMEKNREDLFLYGTERGLPSLIGLLQNQFADYQVFAKSQQFFITSGIQQALAILALMPFPGGKRHVLLEQPGYHNMPPLLRSLGVPMLGVPRSLDSLNWEVLEQRFREEQLKFFYVMPRFHNPLGTSLSAADKKRLIAMASKYEVYLVEDDYLADLEDKSRQDPLWSYDTEDRVIYLKSFSKILFPGLRIGAAVLPPALSETFSLHKRMLDIDSSILSQAALDMYIRNGMFAQHRKTIQSRYSRRMGKLFEALDRYPDFAPFRLVPRTGGEHTVLPLPDNIRQDHFVQRLRAQGIIASTIEPYFFEKTAFPQMLRLNISNIHEERIEEGIHALHQTLASLLNSH